MVGPHGVPWPAFRSALPGSDCWDPVLVPPTGRHHPPTPTLGKQASAQPRKNGACTENCPSAPSLSHISIYVLFKFNSGKMYFDLKYLSFCFTPSEDFLDGLDRTDMVKEVFPGCRWISCMVINYVCNLCKGGSRKLGEHHSSACNEDWLSAPCLTSALNADKQTAPSLSSTISLPCLATLIPATCHLWHTMLNALVSTGTFHFIFFHGRLREVLQAAQIPRSSFHQCCCWQRGSWV